MGKTELLKYLMENNINVSVEQIAIGTVVTVILSLYLYWFYKKMYTGVIYSKSFNVTLVMITLITSMIMQVIGSNLALSLGMVGALSIIRFRTAIKDPKDSAFLFWAIGLGLACGVGIYSVAVICSIAISIVLFFLNLGVMSTTSYLLVLQGTEQCSMEKVKEAIQKYVKKSRHKMETKSGDHIEITYEILVKDSEIDQLTKELSSVEHVESVHIVSYQGEVA